MPPLILWAIGTIGAALAARWLMRESQRVNGELHADERMRARDRAAQTLERDPETGIYRPR